MAEREAMEYDVVIAGAGPAGLAAGIRLNAYPKAFEAGWLKEELHKARNFKPCPARAFALHYCGGLLHFTTVAEAVPVYRRAFRKQRIRQGDKDNDDR